MNRDVKQNDFLFKFSVVCITCYFEKDIGFFNDLQQIYGNITIINDKFDDRTDTYNRKYTNQLGCKRLLFELPIDYFGNVHLCCYDWNNHYEIGNINETNLDEIIRSDVYQKLLANTKNRLFDPINSPQVCINCNHPMVKYPKMI